MPKTSARFSDVSVGTVELSARPNQDWQKYFWTANLQHSVERSLIALQLRGPNAKHPVDIAINVRCCLGLVILLGFLALYSGVYVCIWVDTATLLAPRVLFRVCCSQLHAVCTFEHLSAPRVRVTSMCRGLVSTWDEWW